MLLLKFGWAHSMMIPLRLWGLCWCRCPQEK
uniref:Uncharacterized protein n=1 Tax=Arundo donax TaxID=35708 RepID=A0A0A9DZX8_ARUDO